MADLFARTEVDFGGAMHAQNGIVTPTKGLTGVLMQNISLSYQQQVTRLYELGTYGRKTKVYYVGGRASGTMSTGHVIGPGVSMALFYANFGDVCKAGTNSFTLDLTPNMCGTVPGTGSVVSTTGVPQAVRAKYECKYCVLVGIGIGVGAQDFVVNESSQLMFSGLDFLG